MKYPLRLEEIEPSLEFFNEVVTLIKESKEYLSRQTWCKVIYQGWLFTNIGYALNIFLYKIENKQSPEDNFLWIVVGDLPPIYLDTYDIKTTKDVIETYIDLVEDWIVHARSGQSLNECFPFEASNSKESVTMLEHRVQLLRNNILPKIINIDRNVVLENK